MASIQELEALIRKARSDYYESSESAVEDAIYDLWEDELRLKDPTNPILSEVGSTDNVLAKTKHSIAMGSLNKAMNRFELQDWFSKHNRPVFITYKMDGGSVSLEYNDGLLVKAITRGDGEVGEDITHNAVRFSIPPLVKIDGKKFNGFIRGEIILSDDGWKAVDPDLTSNPRNLAIGLSKRKSDTEDAKHLTVFAFRGYYSNGLEIASTEMEMHGKLTASGFSTPPFFAASTADDIWTVVEGVEKIRSSIPYWIDGMVVSANDISYQKQFEDKRKPDWAVAVKFSPRTYNTVLRSVSFQVGHTGKIVPVGRFDTVVIDGTNVSSALLCNWDIIASLGIAIGDTVEIYKAGDIIPRVLRVIHRPDNRVIIEEPLVCPICGEPVSRKMNGSGYQSADIFCNNENCSSKTIGKIMRYIHSLDIKELGRGVVESLITAGVVNDISSLYDLTVDSIKNVVTDGGKKIGSSTGKKIVENVSAKKSLTIPQLLGSIGVDGLGKGRVENIMEACPEVFDTLQDWFTGKLFNSGIAAVAGVPTTGEGIQSGILSKQKLIESIISKGVEIVAPLKKKEGAKTFSITGTLSKGRKEIAADIEAAGHIFDGGVFSGLDYLVMEDGNSDSGKAVKARGMGIKTISETELYQILCRVSE